MNKRAFFDPTFKLGILGGGQLGKMLCQVTSRWALHTAVLDISRDFPAGQVCSEFVEGDFTDYNDVVEFGKQMDVVTIEIERVNSAALNTLKQQGTIVHPDPGALDIIKDKGLQKQFYDHQGLPTTPHQLFAGKNEIENAVGAGSLKLPFVVKARKDGYDGRGVHIVRTEQDLAECFDAACLVEPLLELEREVSVIVARNQRGEIKSFPPVGMEFHPTANLVEYLYCPAGIGSSIAQEAIQIAQATAESLDMCGLLAVEMFVTTDGQLLINEVAPRPHNSGHHTIEACSVSQFEQHLRAILDLPLADVTLRSPAVMINILGSPGHEGPARYNGLEQCIGIDGVSLHLYGKSTTKPFRKMGHATIVAPRLEQAIETAKFVRSTISVTA